MKTAKRRRVPRSPSDRPELLRYQDRARTIIEGKLAEIGQTWHWLARRLDSEGLCGTAVVMQWKRGRNRSINCGVWLAALDILERGEE